MTPVIPSNVMVAVMVKMAMNIQKRACFSNMRTGFAENYENSVNQ
jgi:hypothetical protein